MQKTITCGVAFLIMAVLSSVAAAVPPARLTTEMIRTRANLYLNEHPEASTELGSLLSTKVVLRGKQIVYEKTPANEPRQLLWRYYAAKKLKPTEELAARQHLDNLLTQILGEYKPGGKPNLLSTADLKVVRKVFVFEATDELGPSAVPPVASAGSSAGYWVAYYQPGWCGWSCCGPVYYGGGLVYADVAATPVPIAQAPLPALRAAATNGAAPPQPAAGDPVMEPDRVQVASLQDVPLGAATKTLSLEGMTARDAGKLFDRGVSGYLRGNASEALVYLSAAVQLDGSDARCWYYKALAEKSLGQAEQARQSAERGAELQLRASPDAQAIAESLEPVQGPLRQWLIQTFQARQLR